MKLIQTLTLTSAALLLTAVPALADTFLAEPGGINRVSFESDAVLETITGLTTTVNAKFDVDPAAPTKAKGTLTVPVKSLETGNETRDGHLQSEAWLDADNHPDIEVAFDGVDLPRGAKLVDGKPLEGKADVRLTIKGKTKTMQVPITVSYHKLTERLKKAYFKNDIVRVKTSFDVTLSDFGVVAPEHLAGVKVADKVAIKAQLTAVKQ